LTDSAVCGYDTAAKMNPPLRTQADIDALIEGLSDGTIDAIATDHAPHSSIEKDVEFDVAANGVVGLETSLGLMLGLLNSKANKKALSLETVISAMTINPSKVMNLTTGTLGIGKEADITLINLEKKWTINSEEFRSKGRNTPFEGMSIKGRVVRTLVKGETIFELNEGKAT
ncbi:MAG: amidohydrolase family protein, partial [Deltaproteobacteria bacterium]|nr:amidohydrolase family protein [Deltaproteobacteria bacterium]